MRIAIAADHAGYGLKEEIKYTIERELNAKVTDFGTDSENSVDYPDYAQKVAQAIQRKEADLGILICGTGIGMSIAANKFEGIRAARCCTAVDATMAREHNDANVLTLGARTMDEAQAMQIVKAFLLTDSSAEERHLKRIAKIEGLESLNLSEMLKRR